MKTGFHIDEIYTRHRTPHGHPERVERMRSLLDLAERVDMPGVEMIPARRQATHAELALAHDAAYVEAIASAAGRANVMLDPDTFMCPDSYAVACHAAGAALDLVDRVISGELANGFAAVRPPGHHAESDRAMGFCLFNNIAVAAAYALERHRLERVLVVDWDVHHGNGTQQIFWDDPRVLFLSLHQFPFYPGTGTAEETGGGAAAGMTVNVPMQGGFGDAEYTAAFRRVVRPVADAFSPQLVLVSAGFDAHADDPLGGMRVTAAGFDAMAAAVLDIARVSAGGRCVALLEGGYDVDALGSCTETVLKRMVSPDAPRGELGGDGAFTPVLARVRAALAGKWKL
ncbi:MAG TPA: histone deacetylase [Candidatus Krumholzibacteria bacterium]|nr:histone deacetylase [Candidatus Krumholzibacteria bacterium]